MKILQTIHHKKNELFQVEFFKDKECTEAFDFMDKKDLYIDGLKGDITPLLKLHDNIHTDDVNVCVVNITAPQILQFGKYICGSDEINGQGYGSPQSDTKYYFLNVSDYNDVFEGYAFDNFTNFTPNLSKYIPEDNAVLFLSEEDYNNNLENIDFDKHDYLEPQKNLFFIDCIDDIENLEDLQLHKKLTIFLPHGTQAELQKAEEVGKYLWENFKIKPNLCVLHCFIPKNLLIKTLRPSRADRMYNNEIYGYEMKKICKNINKIITTNSTGILPVQNNERLQVIDCKEMLEEYLKENN